MEVEEVELKIPEPTPERKDASIVPEVFHSNSMVVGESRGQLGLVGDTLTPVGSEVYFQDTGGAVALIIRAISYLERLHESGVRGLESSVLSIIMDVKAAEREREESRDRTGLWIGCRGKAFRKQRRITCDRGPDCGNKSSGSVLRVVG